ncbi:MAG: class I SAM-dependent methyltransferase [Polyangiaceae bacterium]|nr:class I SAM-dependent methyltransferase [Polyangiaceae bacterium]
MRAPVEPPRANSFNFVPVRDLARVRGAPCPLRALPDPGPLGLGDRARQLWLRAPDRLRLFQTFTADFDQRELARVKWDHGQLYADVSRKAAPDDFAADLVKLRPARECATCERRHGCAGAYVFEPGDVFTRDDAAVRAHLEGLRGAVLDLGCGEGRYLGALRPAVERGELRYLGVDPDTAALERLRQLHPWADVRSPEELGAACPAALDHLLVLRSWNHLAEPRSVLSDLVARLRPGGTVLVVDNVAFGLLRDREHARRAEAGPARFEHFRNDAAADAAARLEGLPLARLELHEVHPSCSNQWLLRYERLPEVDP